MGYALGAFIAGLTIGFLIGEAETEARQEPDQRQPGRRLNLFAVSTHSRKAPPRVVLMGDLVDPHLVSAEEFVRLAGVDRDTVERALADVS